MVERHAGVAAVPRDMDIFDIVVERQPVEREMRLQETTVFLSLDLSNDSLDGLGKPAINPRGNLHNWHWLRRLKHEHADDALHPRCAALGIGRDDDVVRARRVASPAPTIQYPEAIFA